ncbi:hypothetical protein O3M35_000580 [Rhynocoris fuscipes]|uniref:Uncharacterized protein n=1 Tax=Rhynocoris fuscipes TaxID=488301 RepID=A0AAW1DMU5_9HEMI
MDALDGCCSCADGTDLSIQESMQKVAITAIILGPIGFALHFWFKKKRLSKHLNKVQGKCAAIYKILHNDANKLKRKYEEEFQKSKVQDSRLNMQRLGSTDNFITSSLSNDNRMAISPPSTVDVKRLEHAVENLTHGMRITNKRLLQLSEQVLFLRKKLEDQSKQYSQSLSTV